jgi:acyl-CoA synthetase (AMP-forming)/AMP-acid ligase II
LSYCSTSCNINLVYKTIREQVFEMAETHPNKVAFIFHKNKGLKLTYSEIKSKAERIAQNFISMGLKKGDRIAFILPNTSELLLSYVAAAFVGLVLSPLDEDFGDELEYMLKLSDPTAILLYNSTQFQATIEKLFPNIDSHPKGEYASEKFASLKHLIFLRDKWHENRELEYQNVWNYDNLVEELIQPDTWHEFPQVNPEDPLTILYSSGTSGRSKG